MEKKYGVAVAIVTLAAVLTAGCDTEKTEDAASTAESTVAAISSAGENTTSGTAPKGESTTSEDEKKLTDFKAEGFKTGDDITAQAEAAAQMLAEKHERLTVADGAYQVNVTLSGGNDRAKTANPTELTVKDGRATIKIVWNSDKYDYMEAGGIRFTPEIQNGHSVFIVSVTELDKSLAMVDDTTAMNTPHVINYQLIFELQK